MGRGTAHRSRVAAIIALAACSGESKRVTPTGSQLGAAITAAVAQAGRARSPWRCGAADGPTLVAETLAIGDHAWTLAGHSATLAGEPRALVIGAVADAGGAAPKTIAALGRLRAQLAKADVVLALGGMGTTREELVATLAAVAGEAQLVVALPGDLEDVGALTAAVAELRAKGLHVLDGRRVQRIALPGAAIAIVPGASAASRLVAGPEGCMFARAAVDAAVTELADTKGIRVLASAEAPRQDLAGEPSGELAITTVAGTAVDVALHAPTGEPAARARTGGHDGDAIALTPGSADALPRLPTPGRAPTAGLLSVRGDSWTWKIVTDAAE